MIRDTDETAPKTPSKEESEAPPKLTHLDDVLVRELGQFGWFQQRNVLLLIVPMMMYAFINEYVFSAAAVPHRCRIPECNEQSKLHDYSPEWILNAVPETGSGFASCKRYAPVAWGSNGTDGCPVTLFDHSTTVPCEGFVYARVNSVVYDFDLGCQDWLRALAGTLNSLGTLLALPLTGYASDRFGRKIVLVINAFNLGLFSLLRAFSVNYTMYLLLQILQTTFGSGISSTAYIFGTELVGPQYRVLTSSILSSGVVLGQMTLGAIAWLLSPWRVMIITIAVPCFLVVSYYWILPESVRWLLANKQYTEAKKILETVAVCTTPVWWITTMFTFYGLSINSTGLSDKMYLNYILTSSAAIPGYFATIIVLDRIGRKTTLFFGFLLCSACNITFIFIPNESILRLAVYLLGMFFISAVMTSLYLYTSELYPTEFRHRLLGFSSMIGRVGSIVAPLTPAFMNYWYGIPSVMFACLGIISALLVFTQPETLGTKLPDTLKEAEDLGRVTSK